MTNQIDMVAITMLHRHNQHAQGYKTDINQGVPKELEILIANISK